MNRFLSTMRLDVVLQHRNGFYYASATVAIVTIVFMRYIPGDYLRWMLPPILLNNMLVNTYFFIAGLVLLEKREGTLEAQVVTPLRPHEYLLSKTVTLTLLTLVENGALTLFGYGWSLDLAALCIGITISSILFCIVGFLFVVRYDSINEYLMPSAAFTMFIFLPLVDYFDIWRSSIYLLHPIQATLLMLTAAFEPVDAWVWVYGIGYPLVWVGMTFVLMLRAYERFVVAREGRG